MTNAPDHVLRIGVLAAIDADDWRGEAVARALLWQIRQHRDDLDVDLRSVSVDAIRRPSSWQPAITAPWPAAVHAVIVDAAVSRSDRERSGIASGDDPNETVIETMMFDDPTLWCSFVEPTLERVAVETRIHMLEHLRVDTDPANGFAAAAAFLGGQLTLTDRYCLARAADPDALDEPHRVLAGGRTTKGAPITAEVARLVSAVHAIAHDSVTDVAALVQRSRDLAAELADERDRHALTERQAADALTAAAKREHSLAERLETALLRASLQDR